jgi:isopenicillin N synthase-like dioxygenase
MVEALDETIPILDLAGEAAADRRLAAEPRWASEHIGFYFIQNHGVDQALSDATFAAAARFHALPMERKQAVQHCGYQG